MKEQILNEITEKVMVKLAKHEVELANINELKKITDAAQKDLEKHNQYVKELISIAKLVTEYGDNFMTKADQINDMGSTLKKQFADLGLNYLDNADVQRAVAILKRSFDVRSRSDQARQIK